MRKIYHFLRSSASEVQMKMFSSQIITNKDDWKNVLNLLLKKTSVWLIFLHVKISYFYLWKYMAFLSGRNLCKNTDVYIIIENIPLVKFIRTCIRDLSGVFSISSLVKISMTSFPAFHGCLCFWVVFCLYNKKNITR